MMLVYLYAMMYMDQFDTEIEEESDESDTNIEEESSS